MPSTRGRQVVLPLTNKSGGGVVAGDVVILDTSNNEAFTTTTSASYGGVIGIAQETIANNATGRVLLAGYAALVNVPSSVTRGHYLFTHTVAKQATGSSSRAVGAFGQFLTGGTTPSAHLFGITDPSVSGLADPMTTRGDTIYRNASNVTARLPIGSAGKVLSSDGTDASWQTPSAGISSCLATRTTTQSVGANPTMLALNAADIYDPDGWHDPASNNTRLTCPTGKGGKVFTCFVGTEYDHGGTTFRLGFKKNGTTTVSSGLFPDQTYVAGFQAMIYLADGDYIEAGIYGRTTGNIIVTDQNTYVGVMG